MFTSRARVKVEFQIFSERRGVGKSVTGKDKERESEREEKRCIERKKEGYKYSKGCKKKNVYRHKNSDYSVNFNSTNMLRLPLEPKFY